MKSYALYYPAFVVAALGAVMVTTSPIDSPWLTAVIYPMTLVAAAMAVALFLRMLFDPQCRRGIDAAKAELRGDRPWPSMRKVGFFDPEWGLFGSRSGRRPLQILRAILFLEFIVAMVVTGKDRTDVLFLAAASFAVAMLLSIIHIGLNTQPQTL